jgi:hypothetical protein
MILALILLAVGFAIAISTARFGGPRAARRRFARTHSGADGGGDCPSPGLQKEQGQESPTN